MSFALSKTAHTTSGFAIVDAKGRVWGGSLYPTEEAARKTAQACVAGSWSVQRARLVEWGSTRPGNKTVTNESQFILGDAV